MNMEWIWQTVLIVLVGTLLLRIAGRKTISQMTLAETVIMIAIGTLLIQPVVQKNLGITFGAGLILVLTLIVLEYAQMKSDTLEKFLTGKSKVIIEKGSVNETNLAKVRMTVDQLEMNLRQKNVTSISDVEWATLEPNGQVGFTLKKDAQPATKKDIQQLQASIDQLLGSQVKGQTTKTNRNTFKKNNLFTEVKEKGHKYTPPKHLD